LAVITLKNILVATDFGEASDAALAYGRALARTFSARLHVLNVVNDLATQAVAPPAVPMDLGRLQSDLEREARKALVTLVNDGDRDTRVAKVVVLTSSAPALAILSYAREAQIDLIIMGTHGRGGFANFFMGSVAQKVVRAAPCPVLTVRSHEREFLRPDALEKVAHP
jgi:nucleotide-binding universal stress UspA family protein